jgi:hypothetical protein
MNARHELELLFKSRIPIIVLETREEKRALALLGEMRNELGRGVYQWTITEGLVSLSFDFAIDDELDEPEKVLAQIKKSNKSAVYILVDFHPFLNDPVNVRLLKDIALQYETMPRTIVLLSHDLVLPKELQNFATTFTLELPGREVISEIVRSVAKDWARDNSKQRVQADRKSLDILINNLSGLTVSEAKRLAHNAIYDDGAIRENDIPRVMKAKYKLLNQNGILHYEYDSEAFSAIGGFVNLKKWLEQRKHVFHEASYSLDQPKGILLLGVQGCGKSLAAKAVAGTWGIPLLRLDVGSLYNKFHGETERNLRESLNTAEAMAPCVLWIDEIEKGLSISQEDGGTSNRVLATLLTWLAENKAPVFMVATANDIESLPPELIRKGRVDEIFFVDLPEQNNRQTIFEIHLRKRNYDPNHFNTVELAKLSDGFSGAEIEQAVVSSVYVSKANNEPLCDSLLQHEIKSTRSLSVIMSEKITQLRNWAKSRTVSAD